MSEKQEKSEKNKSNEGDEEDNESLPPTNVDGNNQNEQNSKTYSQADDDSNAGENRKESEEEFPHSDISSSQLSKEGTVTSSNLKLSTGSQHFYVLQRNATAVKYVCHLPRSESVNVKARRKIIIVSVLCLIFMLTEIIGGVLSNSLAIAADAAHTLTDFAGFMISLFAIWLAGRKSTDRLSFGWHRAEVIGALASIMTIWFVTAVLVWMAIERCISRDFEIDALIMIITAVFSIVTNIIMAVILLYDSTRTEMSYPSSERISLTLSSQGRHSHSHGFGFLQKCMKNIRISWGKPCSRSKEKRDKKAKQVVEDNLNVRAAILHVLGDGVQSVGVLVAGIIIYFKPDYILADPICTFLFSIIILYTTVRLLKDIILVLMEGTPTYFDYKAVQQIFENIEGVKSVHGLHIWALNIDKIALAVHLVTERGVNAKDVLLKAEQVIHTEYNLYETTIQIEEDVK